LKASTATPEGFDAIFQLRIPNSVEPSLIFVPDTSGVEIETQKSPLRISPTARIVSAKKPDEVAFASVRELAELIRTQKISSVALTEIYLDRIKRYDPKLKFVVTLTETRALAQAKDADREIAAGKYRGPLHGLPWGAKDLLAVKGYPTTWGAGVSKSKSSTKTPPCEAPRRSRRHLDRQICPRRTGYGRSLVRRHHAQSMESSSRFQRFVCRPRFGHRGGCVAFSIGSETLGSISSPSTRCGCTGLRPTFGFVPRPGAMALSWRMDKLGPICRSVEDCALVLDAIYGPDGSDRAVNPHAKFNWNAALDIRQLRVGYLKKDFEPSPEQQNAADAEKPAATPEEQKKRDAARKRREAFRARAAYDRKFNDAAIAKIRAMGVNLIPLEMPKLPYDAMVMMLESEAAAAFDELTRTGRDKLLTEQGPDDWPNSFRSARFFPPSNIFRPVVPAAWPCKQLESVQRS
jgi:hypothetical protein